MPAHSRGGFHVSLNTARLRPEEKSTEREIPSVSSSILQVWTWANNMLSPPWQPFFTLHWQTANTHTNQSLWQQTPAPSWTDRDFLTLCDAKKPGDVNRRREAFLSCKDHRSSNTILFKWKGLQRQHKRIHWIFAYGNHWPDKVLEILSCEELRQKHLRSKYKY